MIADNEELDAILIELEDAECQFSPTWRKRVRASAAIRTLRARVAELQDKYEACKLQAQCWSHEAKAQRSTVLESYQAVSGASGEPGDWNGAEPIRRLVERAELAESQLQQVKADAESYKRRLAAMFPLFEEARDALVAIPLASAKLHNVDLSLADRMDDVGDPAKWAARESRRNDGTA